MATPEVLLTEGRAEDRGQRRGRSRAIAIGAVLLLHAALLVGLRQAHVGHRVDAPHAQARSTVRMVTIQLPPLPLPPPKQQRERQARPDPDARRSAGARLPSVVRAPSPEIDVPREEPRSTVVIAAPSPLPVASSASGPSGRDLLYGAATQRAVRQATQGQPLLAERADQASQAPEQVEASAKLGKEIMKGATGDCLKGEYAGGGMGLLSAPFWLLAEARGKCRR